MKKLYYMLAISSLMVFSIACKKDRLTSGELYGTWQLTELYTDPGDGSGKYRPAEGELQYMTIKRDGKISGNTMLDYVSFKFADNKQQIEVSIANSTRPLLIGFEVNSHRLTLTPPCIEGCGYKFKRVKN